MPTIKSGQRGRVYSTPISLRLATALIAEGEDMDACIQARPNMLATLDSFRDTLEDLGGGLGVTDPVAGPVVLALK